VRLTTLAIFDSESEDVFAVLIIHDL
jgi:hypothetical protein